MATMADIEVAAKQFSEARAALSSVCGVFQQELQAVRLKHLEALKAKVAAAQAQHATLCSLLQQSPELFKKPRSVVLHGVKLGYGKGKGKMVIEDEEKTVRLIKRHFPEQADILISTVEKPAKDALGQLTADELKKLAVLVEDTGDVVFAKDTAAEVDKLVKAFLKVTDEEAESEPERQAA